MNSFKKIYQKKFFYLTLSFYLLVFLLVISLILYIVIEILQPDLTFGKRIFDPILIFLIIFLITIIIPLLAILTLNEYKNYLERKSQTTIKNKDLTLNDIFDNQIREEIIRIILNKPGIHTNEILRKLNLSKGQLQWHLDILINNDIIRKKELGQYTTFYSNLTKENTNYSKILLSKSKTTSEILKIIKENPGINSKTISEKLNMNRSSIKYHIDKLLKQKLIIFEDMGNEKKLYILER